MPARTRTDQAQKRLRRPGRWLAGSALWLLLSALPAAAEPDKGGPKSPDKQGKSDSLITDPFAAGQQQQPAPQQPTQIYEDLLKDAVPAQDLATLIEPLYGRCEDRDDLARRQCEGMRAFLLDRLRSHTFVALSDGVPEISPYDAAGKEVDLEVPGCLTCSAALSVAGEQRYLTTRPQRFTDGKLITAPIAAHQVPLETRIAADRFLERAAPRLRIEMIFRIGAPFGDDLGKLRGVTIIPLAHRVYDRCTGAVAAATPAARGPVAVTPDKNCPPKGADELSQAELVQAAQQAALPDQLTPQQVEAALAPVRDKIHECSVEFTEPTGTARVQLILGGDGKLTQVGLSAPFDKTDIGVCIKQQIRSAGFPRFRGDPMHIDYAFQVN